VARNELTLIAGADSARRRLARYSRWRGPTLALAHFETPILVDNENKVVKEPGREGSAAL
jgi:hypothetical protein